MSVPLPTLVAALRVREARYAEVVRGLEDPANFQNPSKLASLQKERGLLTPFLGATFAEAPDLYRKASPVEYVRPGAPPFLIIHGDVDQSVPVGQSQRLAERLAAAGDPAQLIIVPGAGHGWGPPLLLETVEQVGTFLDRCLCRKA